MRAPEKFQVFLDALRDDVDEDDLRTAMGRIPAHIRERLAEGPIRSRYACGVCQAFGAAFYKSGVFDLTDPMWLVWGYHEAPKADMTRREQLHYGPLANETYERCLATYRAAGWTGEAPEPDA